MRLFAVILMCLYAAPYSTAECWRADMDEPRSWINFLQLQHKLPPADLAPDGVDQKAREHVADRCGSALARAQEIYNDTTTKLIDEHQQVGFRVDVDAPLLLSSSARGGWGQYHRPVQIGTVSDRTGMTVVIAPPEGCPVFKRRLTSNEHTDVQSIMEFAFLYPPNLLTNPSRLFDAASPDIAVVVEGYIVLLRAVEPHKEAYRSLYFMLAGMQNEANEQCQSIKQEQPTQETLPE